MTSLWIWGTRRLSASNASRLICSTWLSRAATTVALRGASAKKPISPIN